MLRLKARASLLSGDLRGSCGPERLSRATMRNIRQNLFLAFVYNAIGVPCRGCAVSVHRHPDQSDLGERRDDAELRVRHRQCPAPAPGSTLAKRDALAGSRGEARDHIRHASVAVGSGCVQQPGVIALHGERNSGNRGHNLLVFGKISDRTGWRIWSVSRSTTELS